MARSLVAVSWLAVEWTIDELARRAGITTRNVRAYQERGLLEPPRKVGRTGYYGEEHLARLSVIGTLLARRYSLSSIGELLSTWSQGGDLGRLLGFERALARPWVSDLSGAYLTPDKLQQRFGTAPGALERVIKLGLVSPASGKRGYDVPSMEALDAGAELVAAGIPLDAVLDEAEELQADVDRIAARFFRLFDRYIWQPFAEAGMPPGQLPRLTELMERLRPIATHGVSRALAMAMQRQLDAAMAAGAGAAEALPRER
jgi:DNA-binding transcriptional MerR regulator